MNYSTKLMGGASLLACVFSGPAGAQPAWQNSGQGPAGNYVVNAVPSTGRGKSSCIDTTGACFSTNTSKPSISCGTATIDANATNTAGQVAITAATASCTITFATPTFTTYAHCSVVDEFAGSTAAFAYTVTTTAISVTATALNGNTLDYVCHGY